MHILQIIDDPRQLVEQHPELSLVDPVTMEDYMDEEAERKRQEAREEDERERQEEEEAERERREGPTSPTGATGKRKAVPTPGSNRPQKRPRTPLDYRHNEDAIVKWVEHGPGIGGQVSDPGDTISDFDDDDYQDHRKYYRDYFFTEYMRNGDLQKFIENYATTTKREYMPNTVLWHVFGCLVRGVIALRYPVKRQPGFDPGPGNKYGPLRSETIPPEGTGKDSELVHFDIDPQNGTYCFISLSFFCPILTNNSLDWQFRYRPRKGQALLHARVQDIGRWYRQNL